MRKKASKNRITVSRNRHSTKDRFKVILLTITIGLFPVKKRSTRSTETVDLGPMDVSLLENWDADSLIELHASKKDEMLVAN